MKACKPNPPERARVLAILQYLQAKYPQFLWIRVEPVGAMRMALKAKGIMRGGKWADSPWSDGVADVLGLSTDSGNVAFEVKRAGGLQRESQRDFERRFLAKAGCYYIVHDPGEVERAMQELGHGS